MQTERTDYIVKRRVAWAHVYLDKTGGLWTTKQSNALRFTKAGATNAARRLRGFGDATYLVRLKPRARAPKVGDIVTWGSCEWGLPVATVAADGVFVLDAGRLRHISWDANGYGYMSFADVEGFGPTVLGRVLDPDAS